MAVKRPLEERLLEGSEVVETGCRRWTGMHQHKGYGQINVGNKNRMVHRMAYEVWIGPIPEGLEIDHVYARGCRYRDCIEPSHLEAVTHAENLRRKPLATHCKNGHEYTSENTQVRTLPDGGPRRACRTCIRARKREWQAKYRSPNRGR
jgi:hypothetical protein